MGGQEAEKAQWVEWVEGYRFWGSVMGGEGGWRVPEGVWKVELTAFLFGSWCVLEITEHSLRLTCVLATSLLS